MRIVAVALLIASVACSNPTKRGPSGGSEGEGDGPITASEGEAETGDEGQGDGAGRGEGGGAGEGEGVGVGEGEGEEREVPDGTECAGREGTDCCSAEGGCEGEGEEPGDPCLEGRFVRFDGGQIEVVDMGHLGNTASAKAAP